MSVTFQYKPVEWTESLEAMFTKTMYTLVSGDDWDSTDAEDRDLLRSFWYAGYITRGAGEGSY